MAKLYILYVDDEPVLLKATKDYLEKNFELRVDSVDSATKAIELIDKNRYDAIISDYEMPEMNGIDFLKKIRSMDHEIPFIIFTGKGREDVVIDALNEGADLYLQKGGNAKVQYTELVNGLKKLVERRKALESLRESEKTARALLDASHSAAALFNPKGIVIDTNEAYPLLFGLSRDDIIGRNVWDLFPKDVAEKRKTVFNEVLRTGKPYRSPNVRWNGFRDYVVYPIRDDSGEVRNVAVFVMDITQKRETEELYHTVFENTGSAMMIIEEDTTISHINGEMENLLGYPKEEIENRLKWPELVSKEYIEKTMEYHRLRRKSPELAPKKYEMDLTTKNGEIKNVALVVTMIPGTKQGVMTLSDITEKKKAEEALRNSEERYRNIIEDQTEFVCRFLPDGTHVFVNEAYCSYFGRRCDEMISKKFIPEIPAQDREKIKAFFRSLRQENPVDTIDHRIIMPNGEIRWQRWSDRAIFDEKGQIKEYQSVGKDITDLMRTEEALEKAMEELRSAHQQLTDIINFLPDAIFAIDLNRNIIAWNRVMEEITGLSSQEMLGKEEQEYSVPFYGEKRPALVDLVLGENIDLERHYPYIRREGDRLISEIHSPHLNNGEGAHFWIIASPLYDAGGNVVGAIESLRDIGGQKEMERSLKTALDNTRRSNAELEQFAYVASHDLQEPLRMISSYVQLLARRYYGRLDSDADEYISYAVDGASRMQKLINDLLDYSRVTTRGKPFEDVNCEKVLYHVMEDMMITIQENDVRITHDPLPVIPGDETQISSVFLNLIGNAIKYRSGEKPEIHISARRKGNVWLFSVRDNGIGIDPQYDKRIFIIFQRLHARTEYPGTGIGLAVTKKIIERHGGHIWVESGTGNGSTFYFTIPVKGEEK